MRAKVWTLRSPIANIDCRGIIPRQLALETLDSLQKILFPFGDRGSHKWLESLTTSGCFDEDCLILPNSADCRRTTENNISYTYWGSRLKILVDELQNPSPHGFQELWERMSKPRHTMQAAVIGIMVAVLLGIMGLAVQILQVWISYKQLKYSTPTGPNWVRNGQIMGSPPAIIETRKIMAWIALTCESLQVSKSPLNAACEYRIKLTKFLLYFHTISFAIINLYLL